MHEAQYHFVNFHQKKLEQTNIIEKRSSFEKKGHVVKQEPKPQQKEADDEDIQEIELSGSYLLCSENLHSGPILFADKEWNCAVSMLLGPEMAELNVRLLIYLQDILVLWKMLF